MPPPDAGGPRAGAIYDYRWHYRVTAMERKLRVLLLAASGLNVDGPGSIDAAARSILKQAPVRAVVVLRRLEQREPLFDAEARRDGERTDVGAHARCLRRDEIAQTVIR